MTAAGQAQVSDTPRLRYIWDQSPGPDEADAAAWAEFGRAWNAGDLRAVVAAWTQLSPRPAGGRQRLVAVGHHRWPRFRQADFLARLWAGRRWSTEAGKDAAGRVTSGSDAAGRASTGAVAAGPPTPGTAPTGQGAAGPARTGWPRGAFATTALRSPAVGGGTWDGRRWSEAWTGRRWSGRRWSEDEGGLAAAGPTTNGPVAAGPWVTGPGAGGVSVTGPGADGPMLPGKAVAGPMRRGTGAAGRATTGADAGGRTSPGRAVGGAPRVGTAAAGPSSTGDAGPVRPPDRSAAAPETCPLGP